MKFLWLLALLAICEGRPTHRRRALRREARDAPFIIGGEVAQPGAWPHQVSLQREREVGFSHTCGGSLIHASWVLSAAHCVALFDDPDPTEFRIRLGAHILSANDEVQELDVESIMEHEGFDILRPGLPDDVAVLELAEPAQVSSPRIAVIQLPDAGQDFAGNPNCWVTGWGRNDRDSDAPSDVLRQANSKVFTNQECEEKYDDLIDLIPILPVHICIGDDNDSIHACHGDSGGPLHCNVGTAQNPDWRVAGIASRTGPLNCENYPSVYMRVSSYLTWIRERVPV